MIRALDRPILLVGINTQKTDFGYYYQEPSLVSRIILARIEEREVEHHYPKLDSFYGSPQCLLLYFARRWLAASNEVLEEGKWYYMHFKTSLFHSNVLYVYFSHNICDF